VDSHISEHSPNMNELKMIELVKKKKKKKKKKKNSRKHVLSAESYLLK
jgi:hypothetical protein